MLYVYFFGEDLILFDFNWRIWIWSEIEEIFEFYIYFFIKKDIFFFWKFFVSLRKEIEVVFRGKYFFSFREFEESLIRDLSFVCYILFLVLGFVDCLICYSRNSIYI